MPRYEGVWPATAPQGYVECCARIQPGLLLCEGPKTQQQLADVLNDVEQMSSKDQGCLFKGLSNMRGTRKSQLAH